jgi:hypothetical protein
LFALLCNQTAHQWARGILPRVTTIHTLKSCAAPDLQTLQTQSRKTHRLPFWTAPTPFRTSGALASSWVIFPKGRRSSRHCNVWNAATNMKTAITTLGEILAVFLIFALGFLLLAL